MNDFSYYNPVRVHFGKNALDKLPDELMTFGKKVLLTYGGGSVKRTGLYDQITAMLKDNGKEIFELAGVMPNPRTEKVYEGIKLCKENGIDFILAVGGGSVIDCSKAVAVGARIDRDFWQTFFKNGEEARDAIPLGVVLTIPATGSEMNNFSVITNWDTSEKNSYGSERIFPKFSILNPTLTYTLPQKQMVNGVVDTMSHVFELYFSPPDEDNVTDSIAEALLHTIIPSARAAIKNPQDYNARANLMWASSVALCGMLSNGKKTDWASHCIEHPLSALYDVAHGEGLAVVYPAYMEYIYRYASTRFARFARRVWGVDPAGKTKDEVAREGVRCTKAFFRELGAPTTLTALGVPAGDINRIAALADLSCYSYKQLSREDVAAILRMAL